MNTQTTNSKQVDIIQSAFGARTLTVEVATYVVLSEQNHTDNLSILYELTMLEA